MREYIKTQLEMVRQKINNDVETFLNRGGEIKNCPAGVMARREISLRLLAEERKQKRKNGETIE